MLQDPLANAGYDLYATVRQCGGPHTLTLPQKKLYKIAQPVGTVDEAANTVSYSSTLVNPTTHKYINVYYRFSQIITFRQLKEIIM